MRDRVLPLVRLGITLLLGALGTLPAPLLGQAAPSGVHRLFTIDGFDAFGVATSPDGRWAVYAQSTSMSDTHLYVRPLGGGAPRALTSGTTVNGSPMFNAAGDRLYFVSNLPARAGDKKYYLVVMPFDTRTGRATGAPRQVSLDGVGDGPYSHPSLSPDGRWVAYVECCEKRFIKVVPSSGGTARTLVPSKSPPGSRPNLAWSADGRSVFYTQFDEARRVLRMMRVSVDGGTPVEVLHRAQGIGLLAPGGRRSVQMVAFGTGDRQRQLRVLQDGNIVLRVSLPNGFDMGSASWSNDGRSLLGMVRDQRAVIRLVPTSGGPSRALTKGPVYDWPAAWSTDGRALFYTTGSDARPGLYSVGLDGKEGVDVPPPSGGDAGMWTTVAGEWAFGRVSWLDTARARIVARNLRDGRVLTLHDGPPAPRLSIRGAGGTYNVDGDAFVYAATIGDRAEIRRTILGGETSVLHTYQSLTMAAGGVAVQNGRVVYAEPAGDSSRVMFAAGGGATPRQLATVAGAPRSVEIAWTVDGRHLAIAAGSGTKLEVIDLAPDGTPTGQRRRVELPFEYAYEHSFLPDGRRIAMIAQYHGAPNAVAAIVSLDDPAHPIILSQDDGTSTWGLMLSPDGERLAYSAEVKPLGTTVYRIDVP
jgi:Tol biopolymer transport system component